LQLRNAGEDISKLGGSGRTRHQQKKEHSTPQEEGTSVVIDGQVTWFPKNATHGKLCTPIGGERFEFVRLPNESLYFTASKNVYEPGEPEVDHYYSLLG
jgi:hypothetical protein